MSDQTKSEDTEAKELVYYGALLNAWCTTRMEMDKSLLWLSTAAIGVLLNLKSSAHCITLWWIAAIAFLITTLSTLYTFHENSVYVDHIINKKEAMQFSKKKLRNLDYVSTFCFVAGIIFSCLIFVGE